jgi:CRISPR-associated protein Cmr6
MSTRRQDLQTVKTTNTTNAGLWLDKYIRNQAREDEESRRILVSEVARSPEPVQYGEFYRRWTMALASRGAEMREANVQGRMVVGLGEESVLETSVALHHTYGVPYIPGSALKGVAASYARHKLGAQTWGVESPAYRALFGVTEEAGYVTFFDALYVPGSGHNGKALYPDVITVHHPNYYHQGSQGPADWDSPTPIPFLSATGKYLIALAGPVEWVAAAFEILGLALADAGIGAKTSSGYGRMVIAPLPDTGRLAQQLTEAESSLPATPEQAVMEAFLRELQALRRDRVAPEIPHFVERWRSLEVGNALKREIAAAILGKVREAKREKASAGKPWYQELLNSLST